jgi:hypothetical protein
VTRDAETASRRFLDTPARVAGAHAACAAFFARELRELAAADDAGAATPRATTMPRRCRQVLTRYTAHVTGSGDAARAADALCDTTMCERKCAAGLVGEARALMEAPAYFLCLKNVRRSLRLFSLKRGVASRVCAPHTCIALLG